MTQAHDPWRERLSDYLDGGLAAEDRAALAEHLSACAACRVVLADLERVVGAARALEGREPARDLWPGIAARLAPRAPGASGPRWLLPFAAGVAATILALFVLRAFAARDTGEAQVAALGERYLLLLHEPLDFASGLDETQYAALAERYARWAMELGERCVGGEELEPTRTELRPGVAEPVELAAGERIGGYFLLATEGREEALALARTCPHLELGGSIEVRRIVVPK